MHNVGISHDVCIVQVHAAPQPPLPRAALPLLPERKPVQSPPQSSWVSSLVARTRPRIWFALSLSSYNLVADYVFVCVSLSSVGVRAPALRGVDSDPTFSKISTLVHLLTHLLKSQYPSTLFTTYTLNALRLSTRPSTPNMYDLAAVQQKV